MDLPADLCRIIGLDFGLRFRYSQGWIAPRAVVISLGATMDIQPSFTEREPYEKGFAEVFRRDIVPKLEPLERDRLKLLPKRRWKVFLSVILTMFPAFLSLIGMLVFWPLGVLGFILTFVVGWIGFHWVRKMEMGHQASLRDSIIEPMCAFFGELEYFRDPGDRFDSNRFGTFGVVEGSRKTRFEDLFVGRYRDTGYKMVEAAFRTRSSSQSSSKKVFDGLLFEIVVPQAFSGRILISPDEGW